MLCSGPQYCVYVNVFILSKYVPMEFLYNQSVSVFYATVLPKFPLRDC